MVAHKKADILADFCAANLRFGIAVAVDQYAEKKNPGDHACQNQHAVHIKLP